MDESPLNENEKKSTEAMKVAPPPTVPPPLPTPTLTNPSNPCLVCSVVPDVYQRSQGRHRGPSTAVAFLCLLGDGGPDSSAV